MNELPKPAINGSHNGKPICFPQADGSRIPYEVYSSPEIYALEQERIFRGPTWSFVALEAEIPNPHDFKSSFVGDTPMVVTRNDDNSLSAWVNRCAHRGAIVCRSARGNARSHVCAYHQWSYDTRGNLRGIPFKHGVKGMPGMPSDFDHKDHGLQPLRVDSYRGLVFASFSDQTPPLYDYIGPAMRPGIDRILHKPIVYLGCTRQYVKANWKLYNENVRDPYHASLLHAFFSTFNIYRAGMRFRIVMSDDGMHDWLMAFHGEGDDGNSAAYREKVASFKEGLRLEHTALLDNVKEYDEFVNTHIQPIFPQLVVTQIQNTLAVRQILPKGPGNFELIFYFFGYADDTPEMRTHRMMQANLVGPAGLISMEDGLATELVQRATADGSDAAAIAEMGRGVPDEQQIPSGISEGHIRAFWRGYQELMGL
ncbi:MAG TPA: Rieske 2Fe-2S domain-containing protein [Candidatus Binataceae bacterium]|nr:Rieske 2Fe-2S domain-containing protein [Candidatus Binataceae bacterium]